MKVGLSIIFIFILFFGCVTSVYKWPPSTISDCKNFDELKGEKKYNKSDCYSYFAVEQNDKSICLTSDLLLTGPCLRQVAFKTKDPAICDSISDGQFEIGLDGSFSSKDRCYFGLSTMEKNFCQQITSPELKENCRKSFDPTYCSELQQITDRGACFGEYLIPGSIYGNEREGLETIFNQNNCQEKIDNYTNAGIIYKRPDSTREISLDQCITVKAAVENNPNLCDSLQKISNFSVDYCYFNLASFSQNKNLCDKLKPSCTYTDSNQQPGADWVQYLPTVFGKEYCVQEANRHDKNYVRLFNTINDVASCAKTQLPKTGLKTVNDCAGLHDSILSRACYGKLATDPIDPIKQDECRKITEIEWMQGLGVNAYRSECYTAIALELKDPTACENQVDIDPSGFCYYELAIATYNVNLCKKIKDAGLSTACENILKTS